MRDRRFYTQSVNDFDPHVSTYNKEIHNNDLTPCTMNPYTCGYCLTTFPSRNRLFYHLEVMNINTKKDGVGKRRRRRSGDKVVKRRRRQKRKALEITAMMGALHLKECLK